MLGFTVSFWQRRTRISSMPSLVLFWLGSLLLPLAFHSSDSYTGKEANCTPHPPSLMLMVQMRLLELVV